MALVDTRTVSSSIRPCFRSGTTPAMSENSAAGRAVRAFANADVAREHSVDLLAPATAGSHVAVHAIRMPDYSLLASPAYSKAVLASPSAAAPSASMGARSRNSVIGGTAALLAAFAKYGLVFFKVGKLGPTLISMLLSIIFFARVFGPAYGIGALALIAIHESGHLLFARMEGITVSAPIFLGPLGAVIGMKQPAKDVRQEAVIAIGGPVIGTMGALVCAMFAASLPAESVLRGLFLALAYFGFFINLFNLIPASPLDGGRVASALSSWANVVGVAVIAGLVLLSLTSGMALNPMLLIILVLAVVGTVQRFRRAEADPRYNDIPASTRMWVGLAYLTMLAITAFGMSTTHAALSAVAVE